MYDVIVVGGGIVGMSTAYHLVWAGAKTLLIDREDRGRATDAGAGILSPETNSRDPDAWFDFAVAAVGYYPTLVQHCRRIREGTQGMPDAVRLWSQSLRTNLPFSTTLEAWFSDVRSVVDSPVSMICTKFPAARHMSCSHC